MTSDDLLQRVEEQVLSLGVGLDLRENEGQVLLQVSCTDTAYTRTYTNHMTLL